MKASLIICVTIIMALSSCKKFIEIEAPRNSLVPANVYKNNDLATSAVLGLYSNMSSSGFASGDGRSITTICGLAADEFIGYGGDLMQVYGNNIIPENVAVGGMWSSMYGRIYNANSILEGLQFATGVSSPVKDQLRGETLFIRAFCYFYLTNLYGEIPLNLGSNYIINGKAGRSSSAQVYEQIIKDLQEAELLLTDAYVTTERVRVNKVVVQAFLARVYLYLGDWANAEKYATQILDKTNTYHLVALDQVFLSNSKEAIWQLVPAANGNTPTGNFLILTSAPTLTQVSLSPELASNVFETNDQRKSTWLRSVTSNSVVYYYPFKYKVRSSTTVSEYTMVFRVAEQLLIRAEAKGRLNKLSEAIADLDAVRLRAGLPLFININPSINQSDLLNAIQQERKVEFLAEWGHRWFDLKRIGSSSLVLSAIKANWTSENILFPIPKAEMDNNPNMTQNKGY